MLKFSENIKIPGKSNGGILDMQLKFLSSHSFERNKSQFYKILCLADLQDFQDQEIKKIALVIKFL